MFINAILNAQGLDTALEQYTVKAEIERNAESSVVIATHNRLYAKVVIKTVPSELYHAKTAGFSISEVNA